MIGFYVFSMWQYNWPYSARSWTLDNWRDFASGLKGIGYDTILASPLITTMPTPLTPSDSAQLEMFGEVVDVLHGELDMRAWICLNPNTVPLNDEAARYTYETRPYYACEDLIDPGDSAALDQMMTRREELLAPLAKVDGVTVIDSDPGGYPGSTITEFVDILAAHRTMFDRLRPGIELIYLMHAGWLHGCRLHEGLLQFGTEPEFVETLSRLKELDPEPWSLAILQAEVTDPLFAWVDGLLSAEKVAIAHRAGLDERVLNFMYGMIEWEPSFPMTSFGDTAAYDAGKMKSARGVMGNAQTHCIQLPNIFAFARGAQNLPVGEDDYVEFADGLIEGQGEAIVRAWKELQGGNAVAMRSIAAELTSLPDEELQPGRLGGLIFSDPRRFVEDLALMLQMRAERQDFISATEAGRNVRAELRRFVEAAEAWQQRVGYRNVWSDQQLHKALGKLRPPFPATIDPYAEMIAGATEVVATPEIAYENVRRQHRLFETHTVDLIAGMKQWLQDQEAAQAEAV